MAPMELQDYGTRVKTPKISSKPRHAVGFHVCSLRMKPFEVFDST